MGRLLWFVLGGIATAVGASIVAGIFADEGDPEPSAPHAEDATNDAVEESERDAQ